MIKPTTDDNEERYYSISTCYNMILYAYTINTKIIIYFWYHLLFLSTISYFFSNNYLKVVDYLIDPFVGGTSAAGPESLSVSCFSKF